MFSIQYNIHNCWYNKEMRMCTNRRWIAWPCRQWCWCRDDCLCQYKCWSLQSWMAYTVKPSVFGSMRNYGYIHTPTQSINEHDCITIGNTSSMNVNTVIHLFSSMQGRCLAGASAFTLNALCCLAYNRRTNLRTLNLMFPQEQIRA